MLQVKLPDGSAREYPRSVRPKDVAAEIGAGLAKATLAAVVDGKVVGADAPLPDSGEVSLRLLTKKDPEALAVMRHSCAHIMARAVMRLFDGVQLAFGPTIDNGFYYDFDLPHKLTEADFPAIEAEMAKIIKLNEPFERIEEPRAKAVAIVRDLRQPLKVEHIEQGLADHATLSFYRQGEFIDLCRGPHVPAAGAIGAFKILSVAGAYWKGDSARQQLQRVYATAFFTPAELEARLKMVEEAKRRDHRVLGKQLDLFATSAMVGPGLILWLPKGALVRSLLEGFVREELTKRGYQTVYTPNIGKIDLYKTSGHFPYYADSQFKPIFETDAGPLVAAWLKKLKAQEISAEEERVLLGLADIMGARRELLDAYEARDTLAGKIAVLEQLDGEQETYLLKPMNCPPPHHDLQEQAPQLSRFAGAIG